MSDARQIGLETRQFTVVALLAVLIAWGALGARGAGFSWVSVYEPHGLRLVDGHTVEYESAYFGAVVRGMLGGPAPEAFTTAHYRMLLPQLVAASVLRWTGSEFWSLALTDLAGAALGVVGTVWLGRTLGLGRTATALAALTYATSPVLVGFMWRNQLHVQAVGSAALASAASIAVLSVVGRAHSNTAARALPVLLYRALALALAWLTASWQYQFHLVLVPALLGYVAVGRARRRASLAAWSIALMLFAALTAAVLTLFAAIGLPVLAENNDPRNALADLFGAARGMSTVDALQRLARPIFRIGQTYHPTIASLALVGLIFLPRPAQAFFVSLLGLTCASLFVIDLDRVAHALSSAVYLSAAAAVTGLPGWVGVTVARIGRRPGHPAALVLALRAALIAVVAWAGLSTNADLWGDYRMFGADATVALFPR